METPDTEQYILLIYILRKIKNKKIKCTLKHYMPVQIIYEYNKFSETESSVKFCASGKHLYIILYM